MKERLAPHAIYAERAILGGILLDAPMPSLEAEDFFLASHQVVWNAMQEMQGSPIDLVTLSAHLGPKVGEIGGMAYLCGLTEGLPRRVRTEEYAAIVRRMKKLRTIIAACEEATEKCLRQNDPAQIVTELGIALKGIKK